MTSKQAGKAAPATISHHYLRSLSQREIADPMTEAQFIIDGMTVRVDADMTHLFDRFTWHFISRGRKSYVVGSTSNKGKRVGLYLHRVILGLGKGEVVDHINGDTLDNRRCNLRKVTATQNNLNSAKKPSKYGHRFRGISTRPRGFSSQIRVNGKITHLGNFKTDVEAAYAYDMASIEHHGEYGRRNFLPLAQ